MEFLNILGFEYSTQEARSSNKMAESGVGIKQKQSLVFCLHSVL